MVRLTIEGRLPGLNEYTKACRSNKYAGAKMKKEAEELISWCIRAQLKDIRFSVPVHIVFRWCESNCRRDLDNIAFAKKFILDALVANGVFAGDGWKYVIGFKDEFRVADKASVEVEITPAG